MISQHSINQLVFVMETLLSIFCEVGILFLNMYCVKFLHTRFTYVRSWKGQFSSDGRKYFELKTKYECKEGTWIVRGALLRKLGCCDCEGSLQQSLCAVTDRSGKRVICFVITDSLNFTKNVDHCQFWKVILHAQPPHIHSTCKDVFSQNIISMITWDTSAHYYFHCFSGKTGFGLQNIHFLHNVREECCQSSHMISAVW